MKSAEDGGSSAQGSVAGCSGRMFVMVVVELSPSGLFLYVFLGEAGAKPTAPA